MSLDRAYATLSIKSIDNDTRTIVGIASSVSTDRDGDVLEPKGAEFTLPMPLLLHHRQDQPIGHVTKARLTRDGWEITATIAKVEEPGELKNRLDLAWQSIKTKLIRGLSVGFRSIEAAGISGGGVHFIRWGWLELSAVTIPSNQDATILAIKQCDTSAASGVTVPATPAATGVSSRQKNPMKISEQLSAKKAELTTKMGRLETLHTADDPTEEQITERDTLTGEVGELTKDVNRLTTLEAGMAATAKSVVIASPHQTSTINGQQTFEVKEPTLPPGIGFARYVICKMAARLSGSSVMDVAKAKYPSMGSLHTYVKAAVAAGTTIVGSPASTWAPDLIDPTNLVSEFIEYLRPKTIIGKFGQGSIPSLRRIPFNIRVVGQTSGGAASWVGEGTQKPVTKYDFSPTTLTWAKVAAIAVLSDELARFSSPSAEALVRDALVGTLVDRLDTDFVDPNKAVSAGVSPASITNTATPVVPTGTNAAALRADLATLIGLFITAEIDLAQGVFIMPTSTALRISLIMTSLGLKEFPELTMAGGTLLGLPVITSQYAAVAASPGNNMIILAAANEIFLSDDGQVSIDMSREATIEMSDDPGNDTGTQVNMFQSNLMALRAERYINWAKRRSAAVQYIEDAAYVG
jgi:HK97 family phage major capsid protein